MENKPENETEDSSSVSSESEEYDPNCDRVKFKDILPLIADIELKELVVANEMAMRSLEIMEKALQGDNWKSGQDVLDIIRPKIKKFDEEIPYDVAPPSVMRTLLSIIRDEYDEEAMMKSVDPSLEQLKSEDNLELYYNKPLPNFRENVLKHLEEIKTEIANMADNIAAVSADHIQQGMTILTLGKSGTVERCLRLAASDRKKNKVYVANSSLGTAGKEMGQALSDCDLDVTVIDATATFAVMEHVDLVLLNAHTILPCGGIRGYAGCYNIAMAAKEHKVPVMVVAPWYKFSHTVINPRAPSFNVGVSPLEAFPDLEPELVAKTKFVVNLYNYLPAEDIDLYLTHQGIHPPSHIYQLMKEQYHDDDLEF